MKPLAFVLCAVFLAGIAGACLLWPPNREQWPNAFFALLQFVSAFAVVLLTFLYVTATQKYVNMTRDQLAEQNREPAIKVSSYHYPEADPFEVQFEIEVANPSVRATSVGLKSIQIGTVFARDIYFEVDQARMKRIIISARDLINVKVKARNFDPPVPIEIGRKTRTLLTFEETFHGILPAINSEV